MWIVMHQKVAQVWRTLIVEIDYYEQLLLQWCYFLMFVKGVCTDLARLLRRNNHEHKHQERSMYIIYLFIYLQAKILVEVEQTENVH